MDGKDIFKRKMRLRLILSPVIFILGIWCVFEFFKLIGMELTKNGKMLVGLITILGYYFAIFRGIKLFQAKMREKRSASELKK